ncbi:hypothetical protein GCM10010412_026850 [Nonomuraea recticatena]|uniref:Uncharacterized protein n=1 Tax=Nonomuraea recticatena TaxID=46178 RepID=A0ABN3RMZ5_9ACTN
MAALPYPPAALTWSGVTTADRPAGELRLGQDQQVIGQDSSLEETVRLMLSRTRLGEAPATS